MIKRSWFFARRLKGTARNNSDLGLGVEVEWGRERCLVFVKMPYCFGALLAHILKIK
jgi:hypothetical protein